MAQTISLVGYACGHCAGNAGCSAGPTALKQSGVLNHCAVKTTWQALLEAESQNDQNETLLAVANISKLLASEIAELTVNKKLFATIGGGHSSGIGTWSGAATALADKGDIGLIWCDAHMDAHTFETSPSNNIHGMPVAALLGYGDKALTHIAHPAPKIKPENLCLVGIRDFEEGEAELLESLNVRVIKIEEVQERGIEDCLKEAYAIATSGTVGFGLSIDLDGFDPNQAPGVGTPVPNGMDVKAFCEAIRQSNNDKLIGIELVEFNPELDKQNKTLNLFGPLLEACFY